MKYSIRLAVFLLIVFYSVNALGNPILLRGRLWDGIVNTPISDAHVFILSTDQETILAHTKTATLNTPFLHPGEWVISNFDGFGEVFIVAFFEETKFNMALKQITITPDFDYNIVLNTKLVLHSPAPGTSGTDGSSPLHLLSLIGWVTNEILATSQRDATITLADKLLQQYKKNPLNLVKDYENVDLDDNMILVQGGTFQMGSNQQVLRYRYNNKYIEKYFGNPIHKVTISDFYIGKYEITQKEWEEVMGNNPSYFKGSDLPVHQITWYEAIEFCNKKSEINGMGKCYEIIKNRIDPTNNNDDDNLKWIVTCDFSKNGYRLPTEAEWEYAARGGNKSNKYHYSGSNLINEVAFYFENSNGKINPVGQKLANELRIHDMSGNIDEWCWDWFHEKYYSLSPTNDPRGAKSGDGRIIRGGSWMTDTKHCQVTYRFYLTPDKALYSLCGMRVVRSSIKKKPFLQTDTINADIERTVDTFKPHLQKFFNIVSMNTEMNGTIKFSININKNGTIETVKINVTLGSNFSDNFLLECREIIMNWKIRVKDTTSYDFEMIF